MYDHIPVHVTSFQNVLSESDTHGLSDFHPRRNEFHEAAKIRLSSGRVVRWTVRERQSKSVEAWSILNLNSSQIQNSPEVKVHLETLKSGGNDGRISIILVVE